ncbi:unnamed protein product, partial [Lymnaea stagnalis]
GKRNWQVQTNFTADITDAFTLGEDGTKFAAIIFNSAPNKLFDLNDHLDSQSLRQAINIPYPTGSGTYTN